MDASDCKFFRGVNLLPLPCRSLWPVPEQISFRAGSVCEEPEDLIAKENAVMIHDFRLQQTAEPRPTKRLAVKKHVYLGIGMRVPLLSSKSF
jgi:hypothetical protein